MNDTSFHNKHENFTDLAYENETLLPDRYVFVLTNRCNLNCKFCFQKKESFNTNLTLDDWSKLIKQLPKYSRVTLTGGEPFLFENFEEVFTLITEKFDCNIISNGLLLSDDMIDLLLSRSKFKVFSLSIEDQYNQNRGVSRAHWETAEKQINKFVKQKSKIRPDVILDVKSVVLDENAAHLYDLYRYAKNKLNRDTHAFQFMKGSELQHSDIMYDFDSIFKEKDAYIYNNISLIKEQIKKISLESDRKTFLHPKVFPLTAESNIDEILKLNKKQLRIDLFKKCKFPWSSVHINYDGNVYPCLSVSMGNIREQSLKDIFFGEDYTKFKHTLKKQGLVSACNRCGWLRLKE